MFLPTVFEEEKGSIEIRGGRVSSRAEHKRERDSKKSRDELLLVYSNLYTAK